MAYVTIVALLALIEFGVFGFLVGRARGKFEIAAPATTGNENFERVYRVHQNTMEQLIVFIPSIYAFAYFVSELWAIGLGVVVLIGRIVYSVGYTKEAEKRALGTMITFIPVQILLFGALVGAVVALF